MPSGSRGNSSGRTHGEQQLSLITAKYNQAKSGANELGLADDSAMVQKLTQAYNNLVDAQSKFIVGEDLTSAEGKEKVEAFNNAKLALNGYLSELNKVINASKKLETNHDKWDVVPENFTDDKQGRIAALKQFVFTQYGKDATLGSFTKGWNTLNFVVKNTDGTFTKMTATINAARTSIHSTAGETKQLTGAFKQFTQDIWGKFKSLGTYFAASMGWQEIWQQLKKGVQYVREIDAALTELKKVTDETSATYDAFLQTMSQTAVRVGSTVKDLTTMAAEWARLNI